MIHVPHLARQRISRPQLRMLQSWPEWIRTTTASIAGSCGITATTLIGVNPGEFFADIAERSSQLRRRSERGEDVHPAERISGAMYEPGYRRVQRNAHLLKRAIKHGVVPARVAELDLPANTATIRAERRSNGARLHFGERRNGHSGDQGTRTPR